MNVLRLGQTVALNSNGAIILHTPNTMHTVGLKQVIHSKKFLSFKNSNIMASATKTKKQAKKATKTAKKATTKKVTAKKTDAVTAGGRSVTSQETINAIVAELKAKTPISYKAIAEKYGLKSLTPIAHIKKHKMGKKSAEAEA